MDGDARPLVGHGEGGQSQRGRDPYRAAGDRQAKPHSFTPKVVVYVAPTSAFAGTPVRTPIPSSR